MENFTAYINSSDDAFIEAGVKRNPNNWYITETNNTYSDKFVTIKKFDSRAHVIVKNSIVDNNFCAYPVGGVTVKPGQTKEVAIGISISFDSKIIAMRATSPRNNWHNLDVSADIVVNKFNDNKISIVVTNNTDKEITVDNDCCIAYIVFDEL